MQTARICTLQVSLTVHISWGTTSCMTSEAGTVLRKTPSSHTSGVVLWDAHASPLPGVTTHGDLWLLGRFGK